MLRSKYSTMKYFLLAVLQFGAMQFALAQISGKLVNTDGKPIVAANVILFNQTDSTFRKATLTNEQGIYLLQNVATGVYSLHISYTGYIAIDTAFEFTASQKDLGVQVMSASVNNLSTVVVSSRKPLLKQTTEGLLVNVENSILTKGSNALELLERSPGVVINKRNNSIELNGKAGVMVMLNGKLMRMSESQLLDLLSSINADDIATIELLASPSAKYDAEGSAGIINIVTKKNKIQGTNGSVTVSAGYGYKEKATAGFNLSHNTAKLSLHGSYNFSHNATYSNMYVDSRQDMPFMGGNIRAMGWDTTYVTYNNHNANAGADVILNAKTTIGANILYTHSKSFGTTYSHLGYNVLPDSVLQYDGWNKGSARWDNVISSVYLERTLRNNEKLTADIDYLYFNNNGPYEVEGTFINKHGEQAGEGQPLSAPAQKGFANTTIKVIVGKADYTKQFNQDLQLNAGFKSAYTNSNSYSGFESLIDGEWTSNTQAVNVIAMKETINAAYVSLNSSVGKSIKLVTGLRYEYSNTQMNDTKTGSNITTRKFGSFFPNITVTKKINEQSELQLGYSKRITRPSYNDLASYVGYSDPTAVYTGNPFLQPTITHNIKVGYTYKTYAVSLLYSRDINIIARYQLSESIDHDMLIISPQNISWQNMLTLQTSIPVKVNSWWMMNYNFTGGPRKYKVEYSKEPFINTYFGYSFSFNQSFKMPKKFSAEINMAYNNTNYNGTQKVQGILRLNAGIKKELPNNIGSLQLSATDVLGSELYNIRYGALTPEAFDIKSHVIVKTETTRFPIIKLAYTKSFGNVKAKTRNVVSGDEQERIRKE